MLNWGTAQRNGFHYPILVFYAEFNYANNSYKWRSPFSGESTPSTVKRFIVLLQAQAS